MKRKREYRIQAKATSFTYVYCYIAARKALNQAKEQHAGWFYFSMMSVIFSAFTIEAYLNHIGLKRFRSWSDLEKKLGPREKLLLFRNFYHLSIDYSQRPFQTLKDIMTVRDALAHGKTQMIVADKISANEDDPAAHFPQPLWKQFCAIDSAQRMFEDMENMVRYLSIQCESKPNPFTTMEIGSSGAQEVENDQN